MISQAYAVLSDASKRRTYDQLGTAGLNGGGGGGEGFGGFPGGGMSFADAGKLFESMFGGISGVSFGFGMPGAAGGGDFQMPPGFGMPGGMGCPRARAAPRFDEIPPGTRVMLKDLQSAAYRNGELGTVSDHDRARGRYTVKLEDGEPLSLKGENLLQLVQDVQLTGIKSEPALNAQRGFVVKQANGRYFVRVGGTTKSFSPSNVLLPVSTRVRICGLEKAAQHNGKWGQITSYSDGRYAVQVDAAGTLLKLRIGNVTI